MVSLRTGLASSSSTAPIRANMAASTRSVWHLGRWPAQAARPCGIDLDQIMTGRAQNRLQITMIASGRLVNDPDRCLADPATQRGQPRLVVAKPLVPAIRKPVDVERVFGNVDPDGILHRLSSPMLVMRGKGEPSPCIRSGHPHRERPSLPWNFQTINRYHTPFQKN